MLFFRFRSVLFFGLLHVFLCNRQHQLDTVLLVDLRRARIVINRHNIRLRVQVFQAADHALADDVVRQAAERLCTDDIRVAAFNKLHHFRGQEPTLAHLAAVADDACDELFEVRIRGRHSEAVRNSVRVLHGADNVAFDADEVVKEDLDRKSVV